MKTIVISLKVNRPIIREENGQRLTYYPAHIVSSRAKDTDLERKLGILIQHGADIKQKHGKQGLTGIDHTVWLIR